MLVRFPVETANDLTKAAGCVFATQRDLHEIAQWPAQVKGVRNSAVRDSLEFASLASKRWSFYHRQGLAVTSVPALKRRITADENVELAILLVARAKWANPPLLGLALARRTWCGHVILDFLATHPSRIIEGPTRISGVGKGVLYGLAEIAFDIGAQVLWGEATKGSAPIYQHVFGLSNVNDLFCVPRPKLGVFRRAMERRFSQLNLR